MLTGGKMQANVTGVGFSSWSHLQIPSAEMGFRQHASRDPGWNGFEAAAGPAKPVHTSLFAAMSSLASVRLANHPPLRVFIIFGGCFGGGSCG